MDKASIVYNPNARNAPSRQRLLSAAAVMRLRGWQVDVLESKEPLHSTELARESALGGASAVFACGGDGTVNEVVNGIVDTPAALGILRAGTGNVFAKEVHVPRRLERALLALVNGREYRFDLGYAEGLEIAGARPEGRRYFLLMCGIGFDGAVVQRVPKMPKRLLGTTSYILWGAAEAMRFKGRPARIEIDGQASDLDLYWLLLGNTRSYGGVADVAMNAVADDGLLDTYVFAGGGLPWILGLGARIALRRHHSSPGVSYSLARSVRIETSGLEVQADGEYFGRTPMTFGIERQALRVLIAPGAADQLLGDNTASVSG